MKRNLLYLSLSLILGGAAFSSCSSDPEVEPKQEPQIVESPDENDNPLELERKQAIELTQEQKSVSEGLNQFNISFTTDACRLADEMNGNTASTVICSPLGAEMVLSMTLNGVDESNRAQIMNYLGVNDINALNSLNSVLLQTLPKADKATSLKLANALWFNTQKVDGINPAYSSVFSNSYYGETFSGDFLNGNNEVLNSINQWGSDHTEGKIPQYLNYLSSDLYATILNAISFNSIWNNELFSNEPATKEVFHGANGDSMVDMMHSNTTYGIKIGEDDDFYLISLPYGNEAFCINILLPKNSEFNTDINNIVTWEKVKDLSNKASYKLADVHLPKFTFDYGFDISKLLVNAGVKDWNGAISFNMFNEHKSGLILFNQKLYINVDEKGTDASAITGVFIDSATPDSSATSKLNLVIDRPFYFFIQEYSTNAMIMSGRITDL